MKPYCLFFVLFLTSCQTNDGKAIHTNGITLNINGFTIITDTITITQKEIVAPELKYDGNYYCFSYSKDSLSGAESFGFYIIDPDYNIKKIKAVPVYDNIGYNDMHVSHDSVIIKPAFDDNQSFYLDEEERSWKMIKAPDDAVFEDNDYYVTSLDRGEWGSATWFKDKKTGIEYETSGILPPEINKFKGAYYLISPGEINIVDDPKLLENVGKGVYISYCSIDKTRAFYERKYISKAKGSRNIFKRKITYEIEDSFYIGPSFIHNDTIYFVVSDSYKIYIAKTENNKLLPVATIGNNLYTKKHPNQYRNLYLNKTIKFYNEDVDLYGLLEISNGDILLHYFKQTYKNE